MKNLTVEQITASFYADMYKITFQDKIKSCATEESNKIASKAAIKALEDFEKQFPKNPKEDKILKSKKMLAQKASAFDDITRLFPDMNPHFFDGVSAVYTSEFSGSMYNRIKSLIRQSEELSRLTSDDNLVIQQLRALFPNTNGFPDQLMKAVRDNIEINKNLAEVIEGLTKKTTKLTDTIIPERDTQHHDIEVVDPNILDVKYADNDIPISDKPELPDDLKNDLKDISDTYPRD